MEALIRRIYIYTHAQTHKTRSNAYPLFCTIKYSQEHATCSCTGETGEREGRVGVICEGDLGRLVLIYITCSNAFGKLAFMALNMWVMVNWKVCARKRSWLI